MANKITTILDLDDRGFKKSIGNMRREIAEADGVTGKFKAGVGSLGDSLKANVGVAAVSAGVAIAAFAAKSIDAASNLAESTNAVGVAFGDASEDVLKLGEDSVDSFGLSERAFNEAAVGFSSFAADVAGKNGDVAGVLDDLMTRAADMASVFNVEVPDAAAAMKSALSGEAEPLKQFGIVMSEAKVQAYALRTGIIKQGESMNDAQKQTARYGFIMEETAKVQGDWAKTSDGLAGTQKKLGATVEDLQAKIGAQLIPVVVPLANVLLDAADAAEKLDVGLTGVETRDKGLFDQIKDSVIGMMNPIQGVAQLSQDASAGYDDLFNSADEAGRAVRESSSLFDAGAKSLADLARETSNAASETIGLGDDLDDTGEAFGASEEATDRAAGALEKHHRATDMAIESLQRLRNEMNDRSGFLNIQTDFDTLKVKGSEAMEAVRVGADDAEQQVRDYELAQIDLTNRVIEYADEVGNIPPTAVSNIVSLIDQGRLDEAEAALANLMRPRETTGTIFVKSQSFKGTSGFGGADGDPATPLAEGGIVKARPGGIIANIGEGGHDEAVIPLSGPNAPALGGNNTINITVQGLTGPQVADEIVSKIREWERRNGRKV